MATERSIADKQALWANDPKPRKRDRLIPYATRIRFEDGQVVAEARVYRVPWTAAYQKQPPSR